MTAYDVINRGAASFSCSALVVCFLFVGGSLTVNARDGRHGEVRAVLSLHSSLLTFCSDPGSFGTLVPGESVGPFQLGMPLADAVRAIAARRAEIREASVVFYPPNPLSTQIVLLLLDLGFELRFAAASQLLVSVTIARLDVLPLRLFDLVLRCDAHKSKAVDD